jgi:hypothetical protein
MAVIALGSLSPGVGAPSGPDVLVHGLAYGVLAWLARRALDPVPGAGGPARARAWLRAVIIACIFGLLIEGLQSRLAYRSAEVRDLAANAVGALIGAAWRPRPPGAA